MTPMKLTKSKLKEIIREEIQILNEKKMNIADKYGNDSAIVMVKTIKKNKNKKPKDILKLLKKDKLFSTYFKYFDEKEILADIELVSRNIKNTFSYKQSFGRD